jgi:hypothetical protein
MKKFALPLSLAPLAAFADEVAAVAVEVGCSGGRDHRK